MGISRTETQIKWSGSNSSSVAAAGSDTSDSQSISENAIAAAVFVKADNNGTPADGDEVEIKILYTGGDPDADPDSADEYEDSAGGNVAAVIDTYNDADPGLRKININTAAKGFKVYAENTQSSGGNSITVSAQYVEQTAT